jgi:hypothetical protein
VIVKGSEDVREALIGGVTPRAIFSDFGRYGQEVAPGVFFLNGSSELWLIAPTLHTPDRAEYDHVDAWRTDDGLLVTLDDADAEPLGLVSLDEPETERRPTTEQLCLLELICSYAEQALRTTRRSQRLEYERDPDSDQRDLTKDLALRLTARALSAGELGGRVRARFRAHRRIRCRPAGHTHA